jgi:hypothetical protein
MGTIKNRKRFFLTFLSKPNNPSSFAFSSISSQTSSDMYSSPQEVQTAPFLNPKSMPKSSTLIIASTNLPPHLQL